MKILSAHAENFASYKEITLDFDHKGLMLVSGPTGAGKSTLCDIVPWVLFGQTAKNGAADDVRSWSTEGQTVGTIHLLADGQRMIIHRSRAPNDLRIANFTTGTITRGKDLADTQKLINNLLGLDADKYLSSSYYHEFSQTASFFTATAKNRRLMTEQMADLSLAIKVTEGTKEAKSELSQNILQIEHSIQTLVNTARRLDTNIETHKRRMETWETDHSNKIDLAIKKIELFDQSETLRVKLEQEALDLKAQGKTCPDCGKQLDKPKTLPKIVPRENPYCSALEQLYNEVSPLKEVLTDMEVEYQGIHTELNLQNISLKNLKIELSDLKTLLDIVDGFRSLLIHRAVTELEQHTNRFLTTHFDAELRVKFNLEGLDKLDITVLKDGNECSFSQLSKGQRQLLKLCFGASVMRQVSNHSGISTNVAFFDESLDGLDESMRTKAYGLFQELATQYDSLYIVDHSPALKEMFSNKLEVMIENGMSSIHET